MSRARKLFVGALLVYNLNCRPIPSGDTLPAALLPVRLVVHQSFTFDSCQPRLQQDYDGNAYFLQANGGHYYSRYPIAQPLLLTPLYLPLALVPGARRWTTATDVLAARVLEKIMASAIAAASVACLFLLLRRVTSERRALLLAAVYAFATNTWSTSSQALWQHGASQLTTVLSLLCLAEFLGNPGCRRAAVGAGLFAALSVAIRPTDLLFLAASLAVLLWRARRPWLLSAYAAPAAVIGGTLAVYNLRTFGQLRGGYEQTLDGRVWSGLAGLMVSPSHGLVVFSPVLLFSLAGAWFWRREARSPVAILWPIALLFVAAQVTALSFWPMWWAGDCYGPRLLADVLPCLILLMAGALDWVARHRVVEAAFGLAVVLSVGAQMVGAFSFPLGFERPEPLWDWRRCPIVENARRGPATQYYRAIAGVAVDLIHGRPPELERSGLRIR